MEPTRSHRMLQSVMTRRPRKVTSFVRSTEVHPQIAVYGSQRMCRSCGAITARSKPFCLECVRVAASSLTRSACGHQWSRKCVADRRFWTNCLNAKWRAA
jgi:hypothetical protein